MKKQLATEIARYIEQYEKHVQGSYEIEKISEDDRPLQGFQQWADGKRLVAAYRMTKIGEDTYYALLIDWHRNDIYYLVLYPHDKSTTIAEMRDVVEQSGSTQIHWKYNPLKRDGKNAERKTYFANRFGSTHIQISLPTSKDDVQVFLDELFSLSNKRQNADRLGHRLQSLKHGNSDNR